MTDIRLLHRGDPCPCCGQRIQTSDSERLWLLSWCAHYRRMPASREEIAYCLDEMDRRRKEPK